MVAEIRVPKLGMSQKEIKVVKWLKTEAEQAQQGEPVVVVETAKVSYEVPAPVSGLIFKLEEVKAKVIIGQVLGVVAESREEFEAYKKTLAQKPVGQMALSLKEAEPEGVRLSFEEEEAEAAQPSAAKVAADLAGRRVKKRLPFVGMRQTIAENLVASLQASAQLTIVAEADMTELASYREQLRLDRPDAPVTFVDMLVKLLPEALKKFPILNSSLVGDEIICWDEYHIGVAVALDDGLVVPVVREVDKKGLFSLSQEIRRLARKARNNELSPEDYQGATFTLTSGGKVEVEIITPIINPPESAILALGKIGPKPKVHQGQLAIRTLVNLCLTHDHRVVDGVPAALFLGWLKELIENPALFRPVLV